MLHTFRNAQGLSVMLTLTYPAEFPMDGRLVKRHWHNFRTWLVRKHGRCGVWFMEFQERGAPHFHVFLDAGVDKQEVSRKWYAIVGSEDPKHLVAGTRVEQLREQHAAPAYAAKYAAKAKQKAVPEGFQEVGRFWGTFGDLDLEPLHEARTAEQLVVDTATGEIEPDQAVRAIRVARGLINARRRERGQRRFRDNGRSGFTGYDIGPAMLYYAQKTGMLPGSETG